MIDPDAFKRVNKIYGLELGDLLSKKTAARLTRALRASDTAGRRGGDEFAVILPFTDVASAARAVVNVLESLQQPLQIDGRSISAACSPDIVAYPDHALDISAMCRCADAAKSEARRRRRGHFIFHPEEYGSPGARRSDR